MYSPSTPRNLSSYACISLELRNRLKAMCLLKKRRGKRGGRRNGNSARLELNYLDGTYANRRHILSNLVTVCKQPAHSLLNNRQEKLIDFCLLNTRSIRNKALIVKDFAVDMNLDIIALTETWLRSGHEADQLIGEL